MTQILTEIGAFLSNTLGVDLGIVLALIFVLEVIKYILSKKTKLKLDSDFWKIIVLIAGFLISFLVISYEDRTVGQIIRDIVITGLKYAAGATIFYQTGKMIYSRLRKKGSTPLISFGEEDSSDGK
jgi:hypothetical protein